jgi:hypothetical protein
MDIQDNTARGQAGPSQQPQVVGAAGGALGLSVHETRNDWVDRPGMGFVWWCLPVGVGFAANFFGFPARTIALVWMLSFVWMGTGCILNARRCHRLHCYISGPAFLLGAAALGLFAAGLRTFGPHSLNNIIGVTLTIALLSFVPEMIWRKYA